MTFKYSFQERSRINSDYTFLSINHFIAKAGICVCLFYFIDFYCVRILIASNFFYVFNSTTKYR